MHISVSSQTTLQNIANYFAFALYDASAPGVLIETVTPPKPYGNPLQISFLTNCISGHIYIIKLWESADGTATGVVRNSFSQEVNASSILIRMTEYLQVDITTGLVSGDRTYTDATLAGWNYKLFRGGILQVPTASGNTECSYTKDTAGWSLVIDGDIFEAGEKFQMDFEPQVIPVAVGTPSNVFSSAEILTASATITSAQKNKALLIQGAGSTIVFNMPPLNTVQDFDFFYFYSCGGNHINAVFNTPGADRFFYPSDRTQLILGQAETLKVYKAFGKWNVDGDLVGYHNAGDLLYCYSKIQINTLVCAGQIVNRADYPRLWAFVQSLGGGVVTDALWNSAFYILDGITYYDNKCCFSTGDGSTTFRLPLLYNISLMPVDDNARAIGSFVNEQGILHQHEETTGTLTSTLFGKGKTRNRANYAGVVASALTDLTSVPTNGTGDNLSRFGVKNLIDNAGVYALIRI